jgi:single-stranded-DNA-specific exonuclease
MRWTHKQIPPREKVVQLSEALQIDDVLSTLLVQRGIETFEQARSFFRPTYELLHDPFLMKDMDKAAERILRAISDEERILVYGDYDVDGTTSVAMMYSFLRELHPEVTTYIPDRYTEGYGISLKGIDYARDNEIGLIIALDCGVKALEQARYAAEKGIDLIVCDHHRPGPELPTAVAVLDPKREDCDYPYKELCGCGVGFKLVQALADRLEMDASRILPLLDLVATAIGADIVPITGENRVLAALGMQQINSQPRPGIKALREQVSKTELSITDVVFILAPRINAAGRMQHGNQAVELLAESDLDRARELAVAIEENNSDRRETDRSITQEALQLIEDEGKADGFTTVVYRPHWHKGVIGIVASRLIETYYRPTLVFTRSGDCLAASARSVKGFDVYEALEQCADLLIQFGGHTYAAGLTMKEENYEAFRDRFEQVVSETIDPKCLEPELRIDAPLDLEQCTPRFYRILKQFAPFGPGNSTPVFYADKLVDNGYGKRVGSDQSHLKLSVSQGSSTVLAGIGFGLGDRLELIEGGRMFRAAFSLDENHWNGRTTLQLRVRDIKSMSEADIPSA